MANATVEKLKALGVRHGEKAFVGLAVVLCVLFIARAASRPSLELTAAQVKSDAEKAEQNLRRTSTSESILAQLDNEGLKNPEFGQQVEAQKGALLSAADFPLVNPWVQPEPGAGRIHDTPELLAPTDLYARPGRGPVLVFALDEEGNRKVKTIEPEKQKAPPKFRRRGRRRAPMMMMGMGRRGRGAPNPAQSFAKAEAERKKEQERKAKELSQALVGQADVEKPKEAEKEEGERQLQPNEKYEETTEGHRWVAITGVFDHKKQRENYATALKVDYTQAHPNYHRLDVERQARQDDGSWGDWGPVDREFNQEVLMNLPEQDDELTPENVRLEALVDFLPFLRAGYWKGVHIAKLVPPERREIPKDNPNMMMGGFNPMMARRGMGAGGPYGPGGAIAAADMEEMADQRGAMGMMRGGMYGGAGFRGSMGGGLSAEETNFPKTEAEQIMIRSLDFSVEPDTVYRFRLRVVVRNPNYKHENVSPGVDSKAEELNGPWSDPTDPVSVPADVAPFAQQMVQGGSDRGPNDQVQFQVARWNPEDGMTVIRTFDAGPGQIIGEPKNSRVPVFDEEAKEDVVSKKFDFNTHQVVLDTRGGQRPMPRLPGVNAPNFEAPALALLLRPDGAVVVRDQAVDTHNDEMKEMKDIYVTALTEAEARNKKPAMNQMMMRRGGMYGGAGGR